ncbi:MAG: hypothetical protein N0C81_17995 [Candidatus Thiodiazotropha lotti]|uniref:Uncharacterized protein n=1 Tax=Candidatus Thiodiazotropha lotti TaxID=2792787 RepID=A0A9E4N0V4_9GAMM|nr:hypothetical protein [Candidatus Thiodiazotropha lotti]ODB99873.1 hypothetical protein A3197_05615 [Candidatus Thiodiazotropha endoloripes]MCG7923812.1 hypothetical protein [Candidatus Thiodiazotropha lotti]MCG7930836.1 hypothetical protein [Candidatus Thiodiazotropha lotti]MCG7940967.1 hypothetical protein [Candidatus Thiodiazotropha lotti]
MAVTSSDQAVRFIQITLGEVGVSRDQLRIDGFTETAHQDNVRHFMKSWSEFERSDESHCERNKKR